MWILIFAMSSSAWSSSEFASVNSHEFTTKAHCMEAKREFEKTFSTMKNTNAKAICVEK